MNFAILPRAILFVKRLFSLFSDFPVIFANLPPLQGTFIGKLAYITTPFPLCQAFFPHLSLFFFLIFECRPSGQVFVNTSVTVRMEMRICRFVNDVLHIREGEQDLFR